MNLSNTFLQFNQENFPLKTLTVTHRDSDISYSEKAFALASKGLNKNKQGSLNRIRLLDFNQSVKK